MAEVQTETKPAEPNTEENVADVKDEAKAEAVEAKADAVETKVEANGADETKAEANAADVTDLEQKIIKQVEYYFGDINLSRDKFLKEEMKQDDGWVPLETMIKFNRLKCLSEDLDVIAKALKKSSAGLMEVSEDDKKIRRCPGHKLPLLDADWRQALKTRSVYVKGFASDADLDAIQEFLEKYGPTEHIQKRRDEQKGFKGSVFVVYKSTDDAKKLVEDKEAKIGDTEMVAMYKEDYFNKKNAEKKEKDLANKRESEEVLKKREEEAEEAFQKRMIKGSILKVSNLNPETKLEDLKSFFGEAEKVVWVDYARGGATEAKVRFDKEGDAQKAWDKLKEKGEGKVVMADKELEGNVLEGEEEEQHWKDVFKAQRDHRNKPRNSQRGQKRPFRGGGGGRRGPPRKQDSDGAPQNKKTKFEDD